MSDPPVQTKKKKKRKKAPSQDSAELTPGPDWNLPEPRRIPRPTFWPAGLAFGITLSLWGIVTSPIIIVFGLVVLVIALGGWIGEMRREAKGS